MDEPEHFQKGKVPAPVMKHSFAFLGRKNYLFSSTPKEAKASAVVYSILETAMANGLDGFKYLEYFLKHLLNEKRKAKKKNLIELEVL